MLSNRAVRYVLVGGSLTLAYTFATALLIQTGICGNRTLASALASLGLIPFSYMAHRTWTWPDASGPVSGASEVVRFLQVYLFTFMANVGLMALSGEMGLPYWVALVTGWVVIPVMNFILNGVLVFKPASLLRIEEKTG